MECQTSKDLVFPACLDEIQIPGFEANTSYRWFLKNKFDQTFTGSGVSDEDGLFTIPVTGPLTKDMFQDFSGDYKLSFETEDEDPDPEPEPDPQQRHGVQITAQIPVPDKIAIIQSLGVNMTRMAIYLIGNVGDPIQGMTSYQLYVEAGIKVML